jgi:hypothetical protein
LYRKKWIQNNTDFNKVYIENRNKLKIIISDLFETYEPLNKGIIKKEFKEMGIDYIKSEINNLIEEYQQNYTKKITEIITNIYNNSENISLKIIKKDIENAGLKYNKNDVSYIIKSLEEDSDEEDEIEIQPKDRKIKTKSVVNEPAWKKLLPVNKTFTKKTNFGDFTALYDGKNFIGNDGKKFQTLNKLNTHYEIELGYKNPGKINPWDRFMYCGASIKKYYK